MQSILDSRFQSRELASLSADAPIVLGELDDVFDLRRRDLARDEGSLLAPSQTRVRVPVAGLGTPAVALPTASPNLMKGSAQDGLKPEKLFEQAAVIGQESEQL